MSTVQNGVRRSGRLSIQKPVQISGVNVEGRDFAAPATTLLLSKHGAMISVGQGLVPEQEVGVFNPETARDEAARVVSMLGKDQGSFMYGVEFQDPDVDFWNITFPASKSFQPAPAKAPAAGNSPAKAADNGEKPGRILPAFAPLLIAEVKPSSLVVASARGSRDYTILLKCPHDSQDEWILLRERSEPLAEILSTRWPFDCPIHGVQMEFPVIANEGKIDPTPSDLSLRGEVKPGVAPFSTRPNGQKGARVQTRYQEARRVWVHGNDAMGNPFTQSTYSVNISRNGARLQGLGFLAGAGVEIELRRNWKKAVYQVVWMGQPGSSLANQVGVLCLHPDRNVWGLT